MASPLHSEGADTQHMTDPYGEKNTLGAVERILPNAPTSKAALYLRILKVPICQIQSLVL